METCLKLVAAIISLVTAVFSATKLFNKVPSPPSLPASEQGSGVQMEATDHVTNNILCRIAIQQWRLYERARGRFIALLVGFISGGIAVFLSVTVSATGSAKSEGATHVSSIAVFLSILAFFLAFISMVVLMISTSGTNDETIKADIKQLEGLLKRHPPQGPF